MAKNFGAIAFTPAVQAEQEKHGSLLQYIRMTAQGPDTNVLGPWEQNFIESMEGFYMASVSETGWPYVQFRGGPTGFLKVLDEKTLGFADFRGNKQYISVGNLKQEPRVALFLMDYARQARLKILGRAKILEGPGAKETIARLEMPGYPAKVERAMLIHLEAFDWNCQQHIPLRFSEAQVSQAVLPLKQRVEQLEAELARLRANQQ
ncbi:MAG: pyridoxamine 5'-phosphate oxidase family protein [Bryobacter sp.]